MAEAIENVIDSWLIERFTGEMGSGSAYASSKLSQIKTAILRTPKDWESWIFPALGVSSRFTFRQPAGHMMRSDVKINKHIVYLLTFITHDAESAAIQQSRTLLTRAEIALNAMRLDLSTPTNDYGEIVQKITYYSTPEAPDAGASRLRKYIDTKESGKWFVAQDITVVFITTTGV